ncbi:MAG: leucine-rich repeat domain-containing protein [Ruminococcaceae bacterium]|nr:leucine-rich repeat domain-containing protein [Oscillospiraceae bacterium]
MKKIVLLALVLSLVSGLLIGCDEFFAPGTTNDPPSEEGDATGDNDNTSDKTESENNGSAGGNTSGGTNSGTDINGDGVVDENDRIPDDSTNERPNDGGNTTPPANPETPTGPATIEYEQDLRLAESPDDMIFTCMGASNKTLSGSVSISATYKDQYPVISVWMGAFAGCTGITDVTIAEGITRIYAQAFIGCTGMTDIYLPSTLTSIGMEAFAACKNLTNIHFRGTKAQWETIAKEDDWAPSVGQYVIHCTDGDIVVDQQ